MKKKSILVLLMALAVFMSFSVMGFARASSETADGPAGLYLPNTGISLESAAILEAESAEDLESAKNAVRPQIIILRLDDEANIVNKSGQVISALTSAETSFGNCVYGFYISSEIQADTVLAYVAEKNLKEFFVVADYTKTALIARVNSDNYYARGVVDFRSQSIYDSGWQDLVNKTNEVNAKTVLLNASSVTKPLAEYLQQRVMQVWAQSKTDQITDLANLVFAGVNGIVCGDYEALYDLYSKVTVSNSITRSPLLVAHRGTPNSYPENSLESAVCAYESGARAIELDFHFTSDRVPVVVHDAELNKYMTPDNNAFMSEKYPELMPYFNVSQMTAEQVKEIEIFNKNDPNGDKIYKIATLEEFFAEFSQDKYSDLVLIVEIKATNATRMIAVNELINKYNMSSKMNYISFHSHMLEAAKALNPEISTGLLTRQLDASLTTYKDKIAAINDMCLPYYSTYHPNVTPDREFYRQAALRGISFWSWTFGDRNDIARATRLGLQGITNDYSESGKVLINRVYKSAVKIKAGEATDINITASTYTGVETLVTPSCMIYLSGEQIGFANGKVTASLVGKSTVVFGYTTDGYTLYTEPVEIESEKNQFNYELSADNYDAQTNTFGFVYDGTEKTVTIDESGLPNGTKVTYANNVMTDVGQKTVRITLEHANYITKRFSATFAISKATAQITADESYSFVYDGSVKLPIGITANHQESQIVFQPADCILPGEYNVTVTVAESKNYLAAQTTVKLIITPLNFGDEIIFESKQFTYDTGAKSLSVEGITEGAEVSYENNGKINAGQYTVTATVTKTGYTPKILTATLTINKAQAVIAGDAEQSYDYTGSAIKVQAVLNHSETELEYDGNYTETGEYNVKVSAKETANYLAAEREIKLTINKKEREGCGKASAAQIATTAAVLCAAFLVIFKRS